MDGLVCVPQPGGRRICDNDLTGVQSTEDAEPPPAKDAGAQDGTATDGPAGYSAQPPQDSAPPADTCAPGDAAGD